MQGLTSGFPIMFHWIMCLFLTNIILFDCYSFVVQVEIRKYGTSNFVLLSQNYFGYLGSYNTYLALTNLGIFFFSICENCLLDLHRDCIESIDDFG